MDKDELRERSEALAIRIVRLYQYVIREKHETILSKQLLRSGTSIGANITEAHYAQSRSDFIAKLSIALKEAAETKYWLQLLHRTDYLTNEEQQSLLNDLQPLLRLLSSSIRTAKGHT